MAYEIIHINGAKTKVRDLAYSSKRMGEEYLTVNIKSAAPIDFSIGDYIEYRGSQFYLNVIPSVKKRSSRGSVGDAFAYDNVKFSSAALELTDCTFLDVVINDNQLHTALPEFSFYCESVTALGDRLKENLKRISKDGASWNIVYGDISAAKKNISVTASNINCWEALCLAKSEFNVDFSVTGRTITIGKVVNALNDEALRYGKGKGLVTIERTTDDSQQVITRLRAYGNSTNMPSRYYANVDAECHMPIAGKSVLETRKEWFEGVSGTLPDEITSTPEFNSNPRYWVSLFNAIGGLLREYDGCVLGSTAMYAFPPSCFTTYDDEAKASIVYDVNHKAYIVAAYHQYNFVCNYVFAINATKAEANAIDTIVFETCIDKDVWPAEYRYGVKDIPNNLHIERLMLPSFPTVADPHIDSANIGELGVREASVYFDGTDDREDIYPTIENIGCVVTDSSGYNDNGVFGTDTTTENVPPFEVEISFTGDERFDFDPWEYRVAGEKLRMSMKSGMCMGREFEVIKCEKIEGTRSYKLTCNRVEDTGLRLYFPYRTYYLSHNDKFVLLGISMPKVYVDAAAAKLQTEAEKYLQANCEVKYKYNIQISSIYVHSGKDWHDTICAGQTITFTDDDIAGGNVSLPIDSVEIKEGTEGLPKYTIALSDEPAVSTITRVQNAVTAVAQSAITELFALNFRRNGVLVGVYNPAEKGLVVELGNTGNEEGGEFSSDEDSFFERVDIGEKTIKEIVEDEDGNEIETERVVRDYAVRLKPEYSGLFSEGWLSAYGVNPNAGSGGGGGSAVNLSPNAWTKEEDFADNLALASNLGWGLYDAMNTVAVSLADFDERLKAMGIAIENAGEKLTFPVTGSGNAVTNIVKSGTTVTITKGATFLTGNQTITLSGDVTGSGTTSISATIGNGVVTNAKLANSSITINGTATSLGGSFRTATITAGTAGTSSATSGYTLAVPYLTMNAYGIVTGYGTHTHTVNNIPNSSLQNSSMTLWGNSVSLGGSTNSSITIKNGSKSVTLSVDSNGYLQVNSGFYSTSFISAYGVGTAATALPTTGGTLTGNLRLKNSANYGMKLNFGDGEYVYLHEDQDDRLLIYAAAGLLLRGSDTTSTTHNYVWIEKGSSSKSTSTGDQADVVTVGSRLHIGNTWRGDQKAWQLYVDKDASGSTGAALFYGNVSVYGTVSQTSDVRLKDIGENIVLRIKDIAEAPCFMYKFKDDNSKSIYIGSSAQYWRELLPNAVSEDNEGWLGLDYSAVNFAAVVSLAKRSETHEERIKRLEKENKELRNKIVELERA